MDCENAVGLAQFAVPVNAEGFAYLLQSTRSDRSSGFSAVKLGIPKSDLRVGLDGGLYERQPLGKCAVPFRGVAVLKLLTTVPGGVTGLAQDLKVVLSMVSAVTYASLVVHM